MDDLKFRRIAYADPKCADDDFVSAKANDPQKQQLVDELNQFDLKLEDALNITPPPSLADKLLLDQQLKQHQRVKSYKRFIYAAAASVVLTAGMTYSLFSLGPVNLSEHALAHVAHETVAMTSQADVKMDILNKELAAITSNGARFSQQPGRIVYAKECDFQGVKSLHLVMESDLGKVSLFIVPPEKRMEIDRQFASNQQTGTIFEQGDNYIVMVSDSNKALSDAVTVIKSSLV
ncbi:DUF3379 family protein [Shewanella marina]|uniref:DUF3379 family protein n=1 Tax=Shewanella marina TaxID=487319 RepID=UPI00047033CA|nr:DUF3379 family protein [Shewanella marina]